MMGLGDWIMATAEARYYNELHKLPVIFACKEKKRLFWSDEVFSHNPRIVKEPNGDQKVVVIENYPGKRPYVDSIRHDGKGYVIKYRENFRAEPGEIFFDRDERSSLADGCIILEPHVKEENFKRNKAWPWERWQDLVDALPRVPFCQLDYGKPMLRGVQALPSKTFRQALAHVDRCSVLVTTDGALHHAAAALETDSIVLWGGLASPLNLGYSSQTNLWWGEQPCGKAYKCSHCEAAMKAITLDEVLEALNEMCAGRVVT